jgi:putative transposase
MALCEISSIGDVREMRGKTIAPAPDQVFRISDALYRIKSQSSIKYYSVIKTEIGWNCNCPDHTYRGTKCKHIWAVELSQSLREQAKKSIALEPIIVTDCPSCHSQDIKKYGIRHNKSGDIQKYACKACSKIFSINVGFERMKHNPQAITAAMQLYFSGESLRNTMRSLRLIGVDVSHQTVSNWISKYTRIMKAYVDNIKPGVGSIWRADEIYIKVKGDMKYLFALMDDETRYWIAQEVADTKDKHDARTLFKEARE